MLSRFTQSKTGPVLIIITIILAIWYASVVNLNSKWTIERYEKAEHDWTVSELVRDTMSQERPVIPAAHQVFIEIYKTTILKKITSKRSLVYHSWITFSSTMLGFVFGTILGISLAVLITHNKAMNKSLMPWIIASQTIPILAIAPMIIIIFNSIGYSGLLPKAFISTYLSFFPVAVGMVKGLRSPETAQLDLMHTYNASAAQTFWKLRWPSSLPFLFTSMKVAIAASLIGAIVAELPTGAVQGLGARLLAGSYYGQTIQIWSALFMAAALAASLVALVGVAERIMLKRMGAKS